MTKRVNKYKDTLQFLCKCDKHTANSIISSAKPEFISCISDICYNLLAGRVKLKPTEKNKLAKYKSHIRKIANRKTTQKTKKQLIQKGGFIGALLRPLLTSIIAPVAQSLLTQQ